ncbi:MAG: glycosyltransferase [Acidobacteria bacterium]|nr:glycosyltransferase [Acidobacteriota bacterium]
MTERSLIALIDARDIAPHDLDTRIARLSAADALGLVVTQAVVMIAAEATGRSRADGASPPRQPASPPAPSWPEGWNAAAEASGVQALAWAADLAAQHDAPLLLVGPGAWPTLEAVEALADALTHDPLLGCAVPRVSPRGGPAAHVFAPAQGDDTTGTLVPVRALAYAPDFQFLTETLAPLLLLRADIPANLPVVVDGWHDVWGACEDLLTRARRAGFRTVLCNRIAIEAEAWGPMVPEADHARIVERFPETARMLTARAGRQPFGVEAVMSAAWERPSSLLLDARNLAAVFNGTSSAILGMADALYRARPDGHVGLWVHADVDAWWQLSVRYPRWTLHHAGTPFPAYAAGLRLSQPWSHDEVDSLGAHAAVTAYWMLDTIAWDIVYTAPDEIDGVWARLGVEADVLMFISAFSRDRFERRFGWQAGVAVDVCSLSLMRDDYTGVTSSEGPAPPYWLLIGNRYDHKHIAPTVDLLTRAFPTQPLVVFGDRDQVRTPLVTRFDSGSVDQAVVEACFSRADIIVFPSFYEGFGLPIVHGLACGRTVVARASALVDELAARYRGPGRLHTFRTERELVDVMTALRRGDEVPAVALGTAADAGTWNWDAAARLALAHLSDAVAVSPSPQLRARAGLARGFSRRLRETRSVP